MSNQTKSKLCDTMKPTQDQMQYFTAVSDIHTGDSDKTYLY